MNNIRNSYLFPKNAPRYSSVANVHTMLVNTLGLNDNYNSSLIYKCILALTYVCDFITIEELTTFLGLPEEGKEIGNVTVALNRLVKNKLLKTVDFSNPDGLSRKAYYLTKAGFNEAYSSFDNIQLKEYKRKSASGVTTLHDYSVGMNVLGLILFGYPFIFGKEISEGLSQKTGKKIEKTLTYDGLVIFKDNYEQNRKERIYIEEDLSNEVNRILIAKLSKYEQYRIMDNPLYESLVFSFRRPNCVEPKYPRAYAITPLIKILDILDKYEVPLSSLLNNKEDYPLDDKTLSTVKDLSYTVGLLNKNSVNLANDMTYEDLLSYVYELKTLKNPYRFASINKQHDSMAKGKFKNLAIMMSATYRNAVYKEPYVESMMMGFCVWCVATPLLVNYLPYIVETMSLTIKNMNSLFESKYGHFSYVTALSDVFVKSEGFRRNLRLRNVFKHNDRFIAFEFISRDLGAYFRALRFIEDYLDEGMSYTFVGIVDTYDDACYLSGPQMLDYRVDYLKGNAVSNAFVFLLKQDWQQGKLKFFEINSNNERNGVEL